MGVQREVGTSFGKHQRLLTQSAFKHVFATGKRHSNPLFLVLITPNLGNADSGAQDSPGPPGRVGLAVSKKVSRLAVVRNRIKRYIREAFRKQPQDWVGLDVVVVARRACVDATFADVQSALKRIAQAVDHQSTR